MIKRRGTVSEVPFTAPMPRASCSFERIYFSRGNDVEIYRERQALGGQLATQVIQAIDHDWANTVFSFIPNTPRWRITASCPRCGRNAATR